MLGMHSPFDSEHIVNLKRYFFWQRVATITLIAYVASWVALLFLKTTHIVRFPNIGVYILSLVLIALYTGISLAFIPECSPYQMLYDKCVARTEYSVGFNKEHFSKIRKGMTKPEVSNLVGEGFKEDRHPELEYSAWAYSKPAGYGENYWMYVIVFSNDDLVEDIVVTFWYD